MATRAHDFIIELIKMKMKQLGFIVVASDSHYYKQNAKEIVPPTIIHHRPDCVGYRKSDGHICIGEAKYSGDLSASRTLTQITDYLSLTEKDNRFHFIVGIPLNENIKFMKMINKHDLSLNNNVIVLDVPERLFPNEKT